MFDQDRLRSYGQRMLPLLLVVWLAALIPAAQKLLRFEWTQGSMAQAPAKLSGAGIAYAETPDDRHAGLLVVAIHPLCSCTRATLKELEDSAAAWKQPYRATLLVYKAKAISGDFDWHQAAYIRDAKQALHADVVMDEAGEQAARLGALTSGEVLYYSAADEHGARRLLFSGGVTAGRGMEGENNGIDALERAVQLTTSSNLQNLTASHPPVYGCGLASLSNSNSGGSTAK
jgi:hypothetical protein